MVTESKHYSLLDGYTEVEGPLSKPGQVFRDGREPQRVSLRVWSRPVAESGSQAVMATMDLSCIRASQAGRSSSLSSHIRLPYISTSRPHSTFSSEKPGVSVLDLKRAMCSADRVIHQPVSTTYQQGS
ncbi:hypothetical protein PGT21_030352 [Puccinia graminis f. sp. tritici]|uniref:Uncharacterized protein n=1 Tax=Puccinia graminis f. sp. tritici TaxID=56615 RepID=A0A5B0R6Q4_PUCGR|nr:hypothetical protein PGT21_030352 [Puccinia graminis f. sp. tritici]KAA1120675.1 hypothetical protein PGTUg99_022419 [Puccinia graminis f. sp. tritici]